MVSSLNPYNMVHDALWQLVEGHPCADDILPVGNRIKFNDPDNRDPIKHDIAVADTPELMLVVTGNSPVALFTTSSTSKITYQFSFLLSTGDYRCNLLLHPVEWLITCAMTRWKEVLGQLYWPDPSWHFCKRLDVVSVGKGESDSERNRGLRGWSSVWGVEVEMHFRTADLRAWTCAGSSSSSSSLWTPDSSSSSSLSSYSSSSSDDGTTESSSSSESSEWTPDPVTTCGCELIRPAGQVISGHRPIALLAGEAFHAANTNVLHRGKVRGISLNAASTSEPARILTYGPIDDSSLNLVEGPVWVGNGVLTQVHPASGWAQQIGYAESQHRMFVDLQMPFQLL